MFVVIFIIIIELYSSYKEQKEKKELSSYKKYQTSQKILNSVTETEKFKRNLLKKDDLPDYKTDVLLYRPHDYIEQICSNIKLLISNITEINLSSLSVTFIYKYPTDNSNWQWITRKNSTLSRNLQEFVIDDNSRSYFHYIISNNFSAHFEHDKGNLVLEGNYWISENDKRFSVLGSIASYKMSFIKNEEYLCIGYMITSTYGRTFVEDKTNQKEIDNFNILLSNTIIPSYRHLIETELGFMYERHKIMNDMCKDGKSA